jgi:D-galactose 1-dehydrogenase
MSSPRRHRIGVIGLGKIAQDQHLPVIAANPAFELVGTSSQRGLTAPGARLTFTNARELMAHKEIDVVAICTPPQVRHRIAREALLAGKHVMLEKPPTATLAELTDLTKIAARAGRVLFTTWHSQYNKAVEATRAFLADRRVMMLEVTWKEDVRHWHPGQQWIWHAGGFGVFDPGINALSIVTRIMPRPVFIARSDLFFPENAQAPIAATLEFVAEREGQVLRAEFDWRQSGEQFWQIAIETEDGAELLLSKGGARLEINGQLEAEEKPAEYEKIYERFDGLLAKGESAVEVEPFELVADAFMMGRRLVVEAFRE